MVVGEQGPVLTGHSLMETVTLTTANRMALAILDLRCMLESDDPHGDRIEMSDLIRDYLQDLQLTFQPMMLERNEIVRMDTDQDQETLIVAHRQESELVRLQLIHISPAMVQMVEDEMIAHHGIEMIGLPEIGKTGRHETEKTDRENEEEMTEMTGDMIGTARD